MLRRIPVRPVSISRAESSTVFPAPFVRRAASSCGGDENAAGGGALTDAPLLPHQLKRIARRASLGVARTGGTASNGSGDIFVAFSTANTGAASAQPTANITLLSNSQISTLFEATVEATEEAIINALVAAETMVGRDGNRSEALSHDQLQEILQRYNRLENG